MPRDKIDYECTSLQALHPEEETQLDKDNRFKVVTPVYMGSFLQTGMLILDTKPEGFPYWAGDQLIYHPKVNFLVPPEVCGKKRWEPKDLDDGLALLRYIDVPFELISCLYGEDSIGETGLRQVCDAAQVVPKQFQEQDTAPINREVIRDYAIDANHNGLSSACWRAKKAIPKTKLNFMGRIFEYVTFFPREAQDFMLSTLEDCVKQIISTIELKATASEEAREKFWKERQLED